MVSLFPCRENVLVWERALHRSGEFQPRGIELSRQEREDADALPTPQGGTPS